MAIAMPYFAQTKMDYAAFTMLTTLFFEYGDFSPA